LLPFAIFERRLLIPDNWLTAAMPVSVERFLLPFRIRVRFDAGQLGGSLFSKSGVHRNPEWSQAAADAIALKNRILSEPDRAIARAVAEIEMAAE
jgi:hypothetical protein